MLRSIAIAFWFSLGLTSAAPAQSVQWTAFEYLEDSLRAEKRPLLIFIHAEWCKYCAMQENTTFSDEALASVLKESFYCLKLDAEITEEITFLGRKYQFQSSRGYHQLAEMLGRKEGPLIFPSTIIMNQQLQIIYQLQGLQKAENLLEVVETVR
ncbi:thioredoxin family protein [Fulvivirga maritima]|uniref:thioredoxin family protein n=1 Tax=Fulvivirga maritima TaxID=2904247 RepID=UPI001F4226A5|nr:thioredoxin family protein [Fulvivirga maritima]UII25831.1 thioredoxin family protein [Fulvivirga maritima]